MEEKAMTKIEAFQKTKRRFTNLIDGNVRNGVSVSQIIQYYESLLNGESNKSSYVMGNIEKSFSEEEILDIVREQEQDLSDDNYLI